MTVLDFRSGGYADPRDAYGAQDADAHGAHWLPRTADWAEDEWDGADPVASPARLRDRDGVLGRVARLTHYLGALVSVFLMVSLAVWGYRLVVRDVSGVPVIRAVEGDARVAPAEPGGELTDRTGLAVNNVAAGAEPGRVDKVAIAPAPTALDGQDVPMGELGATAQEASVVSDEAVADPAEASVALTDAEVARRAAEAQAAAAQGVPEVAPSETDLVAASAAVTDASGQRTQDTAITAALVEAGALPAVATATRPLPRPQRIAAANAVPAAPQVAAEAAPVVLADAAVTSAADAAEAAPVAAETAAEPAVEAPAAPVQAAVATGTPLVQIGAFDSGTIAESEWARVSGRYGDLFAGKAPVVQEHKANGRTFYRLRVAGFESRDAARKFCAALIEAGADCIPAVAK